jgi:hypothetical protein
MSTFAAPYLPRETGVDAALAGTAASGQAPAAAASSCCVISGRKGAQQAARAHQPLRERR